ncbi:hypothetical protein BDQ17DRAFT_1168214, partial [Cyathus striatus]
FIVDNIPETLVLNKLDSGEVVSCHICGDEKMIKQMCEHVGKHVLAKFRGKPDRGLLQEIEVEPCGFCGREDVCITTLTKKRNGAGSITSTCEYQDISMKYKSTTIFKPSNHCTNVPIHCPFCLPSISGVPKTIWKYNAINHFLIFHGK